MTQYMTNMNAKTLLNVLERTGHTGVQESKWIGDFLVESNREEELPMSLRMLVGVGAALSSCFLLLFLAISKVIDFDSAFQLIFWGLVFIANALLMARRSTSHGLVGHSFFVQTSLCSIGVGKIQFTLGCVEMVKDAGHHDLWAANFALLLITLVTWHFYKMALDRFLSAFAVMAMLLVNIVFDSSIGAGREVLMNLYGLGLIVSAGFFFTHDKMTREFMPAGYAALATLAVTVGLFASKFKIGWGEHALILEPFFMNVCLAAALVGLIGWAAGGMKQLAREPLALAAAGAVLLGLVSAPGAIFCIGLMVLGYARQEKMLISGGALAMPYFLWMYYYNMDITLMAKAGILVASGAVLLGGKIYMSARNIGREDKA